MKTATVVLEDGKCLHIKEVTEIYEGTSFIKLFRDCKCIAVITKQIVSIAYLNNEIPPMDELYDEIDVLLDQNEKIHAIKRFREETGLGLKESKEHIDEYQYSRIRKYNL